MGSRSTSSTKAAGMWICIASEFPPIEGGIACAHLQASPRAAQASLQPRNGAGRLHNRLPL